MNNKRDPTRLTVLVPGTGSNMQALLYTCAGPSCGARVVAVGADRRGVPVIRIAEGVGVPMFVRVPSERSSREEWDESSRDAMAAHKSDIMVLTGLLKFVGPEFLMMFPQRMVNTHNTLLPSFPGIHDLADALAYGVKVTGATPFVVDPGTNTGPIPGQTTCPVPKGDSEGALAEQTKEVKRVQLVGLIG